MDMNIKELIAALMKIQEITGEGAPTNVSALRLKVGVALNYDDSSGFSYRRQAARETNFSVWAEAYTDGPSPSTPAS
jgi:hypothetical protein